jgi:hypothetical protein
VKFKGFFEANAVTDICGVFKFDLRKENLMRRREGATTGSSEPDSEFVAHIAPAANMQEDFSPP